MSCVQDENKNPLETEYGLSAYKDHQTLSIQELPEMAPAGQLPRSVDVVADEDLADRCKPGDRVRIIGLFRCLPNKQQGYSSGTFRSASISASLANFQLPSIQNNHHRVQRPAHEQGAAAQLRGAGRGQHT
jgi:DNA replication licensing factor MCM3